MIDWFVLLTPLVLLPIILLLVFLGCTLDRDGKAVPVVFGYQSQLGTDVERFDAVTTAAFGFFNTVTRIEEGMPQLLAAGEEHVSFGTVSIDDEGDITCQCTITRKPTEDEPDPDPEELDPITKHKTEGEDPPSFKLVRKGDDDFEVV